MLHSEIILLAKMFPFPTIVELEKFIKTYIHCHAKILHYKGGQTQLPDNLRAKMLYFLVSHLVAIEGNSKFQLKIETKTSLARRIVELFPKEKLDDYYSGKNKNNYIHATIRKIREFDDPPKPRKNVSTSSNQSATEESFDIHEDEPEDVEFEEMPPPITNLLHPMTKEEAIVHWTRKEIVSQRAQELQNGETLLSLINKTYPYLKENYSHELFKIDAMKILPIFGFKLDEYRNSWATGIKTWVDLLKLNQYKNASTNEQAAQVFCTIFQFLDFKPTSSIKTYSSVINTASIAQKYFCCQIQNQTNFQKWEQMINKLTKDKFQLVQCEMYDEDDGHPMGTVNQCIERELSRKRKGGDLKNPAKRIKNKIEKLCPFFCVSKRPNDYMFYAKLLNAKWVFVGEESMREGFFAVVSFFYAMDTEFPAPLAKAYEVLQQTLMRIRTHDNVNEKMNDEVSGIVEQFFQRYEELNTSNQDDLHEQMSQD